MCWIATAEECREMDRQAGEMGIAVEMLMHEAGRAVAACALEKYPKSKRIAVVCGKGNNGGDGFVAAKLLAEHQKNVDVFVAALEVELNENARRECERLQEVGIKPHFTSCAGLGKADVIVDAVLGTGSHGAPRGLAKTAIEAIVESKKPVVAVDIPSGFECDSGAAPGIAVRAAHTVTFGLAKPYLFQGEGLERSGNWIVAPISIPERLLKMPRSARLVKTPRLPERELSAHKGSEGRVLIVAGSANMPGAAVLCAYAALRAGAGLVTVASIRSVCDAVSIHIPEAILRPLLQGKDAAKELSSELPAYDAIVIGPGLSRTDETRGFLGELWNSEIGRAVIDADALNAVSDGVNLPLGENCILTPHPGEAGRLLKLETAQVQADRFGNARKLAEQTGTTVLLKGAYSLIAKPGEPLMVNPTGNPGMAAPGMGDVLSGILGALIAKGLNPFEAASAGTYWHGLAGDICAREIGPVGFLASEVADALPRARATINSSCQDA